MLKLDHTDAPTTDEYATVYVAFELSKAKWKLGVMLPGSAKMSRYTIAGGDLTALAARFEAARTKAARTGKPVRIVSCYEAGFDGHWLHRWLTDQGVINHEIDPASIQVSRPRAARQDRPHRPGTVDAGASGFSAGRAAGVQRGPRAGGGRRGPQTPQPGA